MSDIHFITSGSGALSEPSKDPCNENEAFCHFSWVGRFYTGAHAYISITKEKATVTMIESADDDIIYENDLFPRIKTG